MSSEYSNPSAIAIAESGEGMALPEVLRKLAAIVAAEGDIKLTAELLGESEVALRALWVEESTKAVSYTRSYAMLQCLKLLGSLSDMMTVDMENVKTVHVKLLETLLTSMGAMAQAPILQQNVQNNFDVGDAFNRLARRKAGKTLKEIIEEDEASDGQ